MKPYSSRSWFVLYVIIPICRAMAAAVGDWSPVTMTTLIPAEWHLPTASGTFYFGGSMREISPRKVKPFILKLNLSGEEVTNLKWGGNSSL